MNNRPFLPKSRTQKLFAHPVARMACLWGLVVGMFLLIWFVAGPATDSESTDLAPVEDEPAQWEESINTAWGSSVFKLEFVVPAAMLAVALTWYAYQIRRFSANNSAGLKSFSEGDYSRAAEHFGAIPRWIPGFTFAAATNLGSASLHQGRLSDALTLFVEAERSQAYPAGAKAICAGHLALVSALQGSMEPALAWQTETRKRLPAAPDPGVVEALLAFATAVIDVRCGRYAEFLGWLGESLPKLEGSMTVRTMRQIRVLEAFAVVHVHGEQEPDGVQRGLDGLRPLREGEFACLEAAWPEMRAFLEANAALPAEVATSEEHP